MTARLSVLFLFFCVSAFCGWIIETVFRSVKGRRFINAGFLYGPFVPIYGFGALSAYCIDAFSESFPLTARLILFFLVPSVLEYLTSYLLERLLNLKLWDYSGKRLNLSGRVCFEYSLIWFVLILFDIRWIQPFILSLLGGLSGTVRLVSSSILIVYFIIDVGLSSKLYYDFVRVRRELRDIIASKPDIDSLFADFPRLKRMKRIFRPIAAFPNLLVSVREEMSAFLEALQTKISMKLKSREQLYDEDDPKFGELIREFTQHPVYRTMRDLPHHEHSVYDHSLRVAWLSYKVGTYLNTYIGIRIRDLTRGAMLHDFFLRDWHEQKSPSGRLHAFEHPREALVNARKYFSPISDVERDIILKHMWPLSLIPPRYIETVIVVVMDKVVASREVTAEFVEKSIHRNDR